MSRDRPDAATRRAEIDEIKARHDLLTVIGAHVTLRRAGREYVGLSPFKTERTPSFTVNPAKSFWWCFASNQGGDVIDFVAAIDRIDKGEAIRRLKGGAASSADDGERRRRAEAHAKARAEQQVADQRERDRRAEIAAHLWTDARPADRTDVAVYLARRAIDLDAIEAVYGWRVPVSIRYVPDLPYRVSGDAHERARIAHRGPAMVGAITREPPEAGTQARIVGVHRTWLAAGGRDKLRLDGMPAKLALGQTMGAGGWLHAGPAHLVVGEGYETTLSVVSALALRGIEVASASALSLGNLAGAGTGRGAPHPDGSGRRLPSVRPDPDRPGFMPPRTVRQITILADADGRDRAMTDAQIHRAAAKFRGRGFAVRIAWPEAGTDFNDMLSGGGARDVARAVDVAS